MKIRFPALVVLFVAVTGTSAIGDTANVSVRGLDGRILRPFRPAGPAGVLFFVATDCPVSNAYAPEMQRVCREYSSRGVSCALVYEDVDTSAAPQTLDDQVRRHLREYRHDGVPAVVDRHRSVASVAKASITPQAVVVDRAGSIRYSGRIDNFYAALGRPRQRVTEHDLRDALDAVLAGRPVPRPRTDAVGCHIVDPKSIQREHRH
jgi:hypothetical protein